MFTIDKKTLKNNTYDNCSNSSRIIIHLDVNSAFLSWTAAELLKNGYETDIRKIPAIISNYDNYREGIVLAKSDLAKNFGIKTGEPVISAYRKCNNLKIYLADYVLYRKRSKEIAKILYSYTPDIEQYSIDEWFLDFTHSLMGKDIMKIANEIRYEILKKIGVTVNIGIANCKVLAKTASDFKKPFGLHTLFNSEIEEKLWPLDISKLFLVGKKTEEKLRRLRINTIYDLAHANKSRIRKVLGKAGVELIEYANGIDNSPVITYDKQEKRKSISKSETFKENILQKEYILSKLIDYAMELSATIRKENLKTSRVQVFIKYYDFKVIKDTKGISLTNANNDIIKAVRELFNKVYVERAVRSCGVSLLNLQSEYNIQNDIFTIMDNKNNNNTNIAGKNYSSTNNNDDKNNKENVHDEILDMINAEFGKGKITHASHYINKENIKRHKNIYEDKSFDGM